MRWSGSWSRSAASMRPAAPARETKRPDFFDHYFDEAGMMEGLAMTALNDLPIAVIGGGPVGLAAAAHLVVRGLPVKLYEAGAHVGANLHDWGHVRVFTPWRYCVARASTAILHRHGWHLPPADRMPTGEELASGYLEPLAATPETAAIIETGARVTAISRLGMDKVVSRDREMRPFVLSIA